MSNETEPRIKVPTNVSEQEARQIVYPESAKTKKGRGTMAGVILGGLGVLGLGGGAFMATQGDKAPAPELNPTPTAEAPVTPGETPTITEPTAEPSPTDIPTTPETEFTNEFLPIPAGLSSEDLAQASVDSVESWMSTGATDETIQATKDHIVQLVQSGAASVEEAYTYIAEENAEILTPILFGDNWSSEPSISDYRQYLIEKNAKTIEGGLADLVNNEPLMVTDREVSNVSESETQDGLRIVKFDVTTTYENAEFETTVERIVHTYNEADGTAKLVAHSGSQIS